MIISFAWTTPALLAGAKTMTRREWMASHGARFHAGDLVDAWDHSPRAHSKKVATIRITRTPYQAWSTDLTEEDYDREGFNWLKAHGLWQEVGEVVEAWGRERRLLWVVEFELVDVGPYSATGGRPLSGGADANQHLSNRRGDDGA